MDFRESLRVRAAWLAMGLALSGGVASCGEEAEEAPLEESEGSLSTFVIPFAPYFGAERVECGQTYEGAGTTAASFAIKDLLMFVHGVELVREGGEVEALQLIEDQQWQGDGVALLDFTDATQGCVGDADLNDVVIGKAPPHDDYVGIRFGIGLPPSLNHLDATTAPAPFNKPSTWWTWTGGYRFFQMSIKTEAHEDFYVHLGSTDCTGDPSEGFSCAFDHPFRAELTGFEPGVDGVRINIASILSGVDVNAPVAFEAGDFIAGCMSFAGDPECDTIYTRFGRRFMNEEAVGGQVAFEGEAGSAAMLTVEIGDDDVAQPGHPDFERDPALNLERASTPDSLQSHATGSTLTIGQRTYDRGPGSQCMQCHQQKGPGIGLFDVAGTLWQPDRETPMVGASVKLLAIFAPPCAFGDEREHCQGKPPGFFREEDVVATLVSDKNGNFYATEMPAEAAPPYWPVVVPPEGAEGMAPKAMGFPTGSGSCNMCHGSFKIQLGLPETPDGE